MPDLDDYCTTQEAGKIIGVDQSQVRRYCAAGLLDGDMSTGRWLIPRQSAKDFRRRPPGNPAFRTGK